MPARTYVREAIESRMEVDQSGEIMKLSHYCPWKEHLYELEKELSLPQQIKFCLYEVWDSSPPENRTATALTISGQCAFWHIHLRAVCMASLGKM